MCHAETSDGQISTEECELMRDLEPMSECAKMVVEPVSLVRASTSFLKILHSTEETRDELREWEHVPSEEKIAGSTVEPISPEMATQSNALTGKSLLIHVDPFDSGIGSEEGSDAGENNSGDEITAVIKLTSPKSMSGERERKQLSPEANNHLGSEAVETDGKELQPVSISDGSDKNKVERTWCAGLHRTIGV